MSHSHLSRAAGIRRRAGRRRQTLRWLAGLAVAALSAAALPLALRGDPAQADEGGAGGTVGTVVPGGPVVGGLSQSSAWWAHDTDTLRDSWPYTLGQGDALAQAAAGLDWVYRYSSKTGGIVWAPSIDDQFFTADGTNSLYSTCQLAIDNALVREPITDGRPSTRADFRAVLVGVVLGEYGPGNDYYTAIGHETWVFMQGYTGIVDWNLRDALARAWPEQQTNLTASASQGLADYRQTVHDLAAGVLTDLGPKALQVCVVVNKDFPARAFQPILATDLTAATPNQIVAPGTSLADAVTFSAGPLAAGGTIGWLTGTQVTANGTLYRSARPLTSVAAGAGLLSGTPVGATAVATASTTRSAPGTNVVSAATVLPAGAGVVNSSLQALASGYYTWVWQIDRSAQPVATQAAIEDSYHDGVAVPAESATVRMTLGVATTIQTPAVSKRAAVTDEVCLSLAPGDVWLAPGGTALTVPVVVEAFGPFAYEGQTPVGGTLTPLATQALTFTAPGCQTVTFPGSVSARSGFYFARASLSPSLPAATAQYLTNPAASDGFWAPNETWMVRMEPVVATQVERRFIEEAELPAPLIDRVTLWLRDPGDLWLRSGGSRTTDVGLPATTPVIVPVTAQAYGPWDVPQPTVRNTVGGRTAADDGGHGPFAPTPAQLANPGGAAPAALVGSEALSFTAPGTLPTTGVTQVSPQPDPWSSPDQHTGFYQWTTAIPAGTWFDGFGSDWWIGTETVSIRDRLLHWSLSPESSTNPGAALFDTVSVSQFRPSHGQFSGLTADDGTRWDADDPGARLVVYGPLSPAQNALPAALVGAAEQVEGKWESPAGLPIYDVVEFAGGENTPLVVTNAATGAKEAVWEFGKASLPLRAAPLARAGITDVNGDPVPFYSPAGWFVYVYEFAGDDRTTAFASPFDDPGERTQVTWPGAVDPHPGIDVEKASDAPVAPGVGGGNDRPNNRNQAGTDADTPETAVVLARGQARLFAQVTNVGNVPLVDVWLRDETIAGTATATWVCDESALPEVDESGTIWLRAFTTAHPLAPGDFATCVGTLTGVPAGELHGDLMVVGGTAVGLDLEVTDEDPWYGRHPVRAAIDIEKASGPDGVELTPGLGDYGDGADNITTGWIPVATTPGSDGAPQRLLVGVADADTPETAASLPAGRQAVTFTVTNVGNVPLTDLRLSDTTLSGPEVVIDWPAVTEVIEGHNPLLPGDSFTFVGLLTLGEGQSHADRAEVTAQPLCPDPTGEAIAPTAPPAQDPGAGGEEEDGDDDACGPRVGDDDLWHAWVGSSPAIDIEKSHTRAVEPGLGNHRDLPDNRGEFGLDADTWATAWPGVAGEELALFIRITNVGDEPVTQVRLVDETVSGEVTAAWECPYGVDDEGVFLTDDGLPLLLAPGEGFVCEGLLPGLADDYTHQNLARVAAVGVDSSIGVDDDDALWVRTPPAPELLSTGGWLTPLPPGARGAQSLDLLDTGASAIPRTGGIAGATAVAAALAVGLGLSLLAGRPGGRLGQARRRRPVPARHRAA